MWLIFFCSVSFQSAPMRFFYQISEVKREEKLRTVVPNLKCDDVQNKQTVANIEKKSDPVEKQSENRGPCPIENTGKLIKAETNSELPKLQKSDSSAKPPENTDIIKVNSDNVKNVRDSPMKEKITNGNNVKINQNKICDKQSSERKQSENVKENNIGLANRDSLPVKKESENPSTGEKESNKVPTPKKTTENELKVKEKFLLNPYSGKLESVPLKIAEKPTDTLSQLKKEKSEESPVVNPIPVKKENPEDKTKPEEGKDARKSSVNLLKSFRREKAPPTPSPNRDGKMQVKNGNGDSLTITTITKREKPSGKEEASVSIEIKTENKNCEYDFDSSSPPNKIMSLKEYTKSEQFKTKFGKNVNPWLSLPGFRKQMLKENGGSEEQVAKKEKVKMVPSLYRIGTEQGKKPVQKTPTPNGKTEKPEDKRMSPTVINIKTENQGNKPEIKIEVSESKNDKTSPPKPVKVEKRNGEHGVKQTENTATPGEAKKVDNDKTTKDVVKEDNKKHKIDTLSPEQSKELLRGLLKRMNNEKEQENAKKAKIEENKEKSSSTAMDLTKSDGTQKPAKNPLENLAAMAKKSGDAKNHDNMVEMLIAAAQKPNIETLLKIPQFSQNLKSPPMQMSPTQGKTFQPSELSYALQFYKNLKNQCDPNFLHSQNLHPFQLFQQNIEIVNSHKRLKKQGSETPQRKQAKLSPNPEVPKNDTQKKLSPNADSKPKSQSPPKTSPTKEDVIALKLSVERTLSQIHAEAELQNRIAANYKNMPAIFQYMNRPPLYHPGVTSPGKANQNKSKSSHLPNSQKSPQNSLTPTSSGLTGADPQFFKGEEFNRAVDPNLNPKMTFMEMFQNYLVQQERLNQNQIKHVEKDQKPTVQSKQSTPSPNVINDVFYGAHNDGKKPAEHSPIATSQKS